LGRHNIAGVVSPLGAVARIALAAAVVGVARTPSTSAAPLTAELVVERAPGADDCPDGDGLARLIERIVGPGAGGLVRPGGEVRASVRFSRDASIYRATLLLAGAKQGERTLTDTGPTCTALGRAVGITMALLLDAGLEAASEPPPPAAVVAAPAPRVSQGFVALTVGPALGLVGGSSLAAGLGLGVRLRRRVWLELDGQYVAPRATAFDGGEVDVSLVAARLHLCGVLDGDAAVVLLAACAAGAAGDLRGTGRGYATADGTGQLAWLAAGGGLCVSRPLGRRWLLGVAGDALSPVHKSTFSIGNRGVAYQSSPVAAILQVSVGVKIW
jgi:hypothetical protein